MITSSTHSFYGEGLLRKLANRVITRGRREAEPYKTLIRPYMAYNFRQDMDKINISKETKAKIKILAGKYNYKQVTVLEYLLNGKISINELK